MQPYSREAIVERRQPAVRWSAVFAGAAVAAGAWLVLQLLFTGGALAALDPEAADAARVFSIGPTAGTLLAALVAMFLGGLVAGRVAGHFDRRIAGLHGLLTWAITAVAGLVLIASSLGNLAGGYRGDVAAAAPPPGSVGVIEEALVTVNERLAAQQRPEVTADQVIAAARYSGMPGALPKPAVFVARLDAETDLTRADADAVVTQLGDRTLEVLALAQRVGNYRAAMVESASLAGRAMVAAGVSLFLCLAAAIGGAILATRFLGRPRRRSRIMDTEPGTAVVAPPDELVVRD